MHALARCGLTVVVTSAAITALQTSDTLPAAGGDITITPIYAFAMAPKDEPIEVRIRGWYPGAGGREEAP